MNNKLILKKLNNVWLGVFNIIDGQCPDEDEELAKQTDAVLDELTLVISEIQKSMKILKPCPFCGADAEITNPDGLDGEPDVGYIYILNH